MAGRQAECSCVAAPVRNHSGGSGSFRLLFVQDGLKARDVLSERAQFMSLFDLACLLTQTQVQELLPCLAELGADFSRRKFADILGSHGGSELQFGASGGGAIPSNKAAAEWELRVSKSERLLRDRLGNAGEFE